VAALGRPLISPGSRSDSPAHRPRARHRLFATLGLAPDTIGIDPVKKVFQVHGQGAGGKVVLRRRLRRSGVLVRFGRLSPCPIGKEAWRQRISARSAMRCG